MAKGKKIYWLIFGFTLFLAYIFTAAQPVSKEIVLKARWLSSLESSIPVILGEEPGDSDLFIPFQLRNRFGYIRDDGSYSVNQLQRNNVSLSAAYWSEYEAQPSVIEINDPLDRSVLSIENPEGYPFFLDGKFFIVGKTQDSISEIDADGNILWTYEFPAPVTCVDSASGFLLAGTLDGTVELLNSSGKQVIPPFEPGGSKLAVILGCAISRDATRLALVSGIEDQRFLLLEQSGERYRVVYHEFLSAGYRRPVHISFADNDSRIVFERDIGLGIYDISSRTSVRIPLAGEVACIDLNGEDGFFFVITSLGQGRKYFSAIRYPDTIFMEAPFKSESWFLSRNKNHIYLGSDMGILSLELGEK